MSKESDINKAMTYESKIRVHMFSLPSKQTAYYHIRIKDICSSTA